MNDYFKGFFLIIERKRIVYTSNANFSFIWKYRFSEWECYFEAWTIILM